MSAAPRCWNCGLFGPAGCYLRFSRSPQPKYDYIQVPTPDEGSVDKCIAIHPAPRPVTDPKQEACPAWQGPDWRDEAQLLEEVTRP